ARAAVEAGNADGEIMVQARQTLVRRVRVPGKKHLGQSRIGVEYGAKDVSDDTKALLNAFAEKIGKQIIFTDRLNADENGLYSGNVIYLNSNLEEHAIFAAALHEAMHNVRVYDPEGFRHVQAFVVNYLTAEGKDTDALLGDIAARWGKDAATREVQMEELVCKTVEALAADSEALQRAIENKKNSGILKKVGDALRRIADRIMQYFKGDREQGQRGHNLQAQAFLDDAAALRQMAEMCSKAFENARENEREFGGKENAERFSFAGEKAQTANRSALEQARQMERDGADSEAIRQKTGWHKGYDGKWRFEIDDSKMQVDVSGRFSSNPQLKEKNRLFEKFVDGTINAEEVEQYKRLSKYTPEYLDDYVRHDALFEAYPALKNVLVVFVDGTGDLGSYNPKTNTIKLSEKLKKPANSEQLTKTLVHEMQHAVQALEEFSSGSSTEYWAGKYPVSKLEQENRKKISDILAALDADTVNRFYRYKDLDWALDRILEDESFDTNTDLQKQAERFEEEHDKLYDEFYGNEWFSQIWKLERQIKEPAAFYRDLYYKTAGEIEARDSESRVRLNEQQRKEKRPDIDRDDVVLADGGVSYEIRKDEHGNDFVYIDKTISEGLSPKELISVLNNLIQKKFANRITANKQLFFINSRTAREWVNSRSARTLRYNNRTMYEDKMNVIENADEIISAAKKWIGERSEHNNYAEFARGYIEYKVGNNGYVADVVIGIKNNGSAVLYDLTNIYEKEIAEASYTDKEIESESSRSNASAVKNNISQPTQKSNPSAQNNSDSGKEFDDPNGRYSKDDTIFDDFEDEEWLWQSDEGGAAVDPDDPLGLMTETETENSATTENAFDKLVTENPDEAVYVAFNAAAKTVERTLRSFAGVNPQQADLERVARKVMRQYGIKEKYNPELVGELAADMKAFADDVR
ncbi:MAG: hypothetical protein II513_03680, partial [Ruminococcus sp.]|nr:hypothetical protein [Ruminococcus sp.]